MRAWRAASANAKQWQAAPSRLLVHLLLVQRHLHEIWGRVKHQSQMLNNDKPLALVAMATHTHGRRLPPALNIWILICLIKLKWGTWDRHNSQLFIKVHMNACQDGLGIHSKSEPHDPNGAAKKIELSANLSKYATKWPKNGQKWPKMPQSGPNMTANGPTWP